MKKFRILIILIFIFVLIYASFSLYRKPRPINKNNIVQEEINLKTFSVDYSLKDDKITTYFYENGKVPFVGIKEFITSLDGYFDSSLISYSKENEMTKLSWKYENEEYYMLIDDKKDLVEINDTTFFSFTKEPEYIDYGSNFNVENTIVEGGENIIFDLGKYNLEIFPYKEDILFPLNVLNTLFLMNNIANIIYNGSYYYFFPYYLDNYDEMFEIKKTHSVSSRYSTDFIENRNNGLYFLLDYFYGLKDYKIIKSFKEKIEYYYKKEIYDKKPSINEEALTTFLIKHLDDPHTYMGFSSFYKRSGIFEQLYVPVEDYIYGERNKTINKVLTQLEYQYKDKFYKNDLVRYQGNTAFIKFDEFKVGYDDEIYDKNGNILSDAYLYDTFCLMEKALKEISLNNNNIKNIVIDLSMNGGGVLSSCMSSLGFLTNKNIVTGSKDILNKTTTIEEISVDTNRDGNFKDNDAYTNYKYYILTSEATFSAANLFTSICKDMNIATIIGQKSGGGMCSVNEIALLDGLTFSFSSNYCLQSVKQENNRYEFNDIEFGIYPDIEIDYDKFYDLEYINNLINLH